MPEFNFVGPSYVAQSRYQDDQELINWYCETDPNKAPASEFDSPSRGVIALYPTPGLISNVVPAVGEVRGFNVLPGGTAFLAIVGSGLYYVDTAFVATLVGNLLSNTGIVSIVNNGTAAYMADGANRYAYTWGTGVFLVITDGAFSGGTTVDIVDNYLIYNRPGSMQWGCTNAASIVSGALNFSAKDASSDNLVALIASTEQVFLMGEVTYEVWSNSGAFPFPFERIPGTTRQHGIAAPFSMARLGEGFAWLTQDTRGQSIVAMMIGYDSQRISNHAVEYAINSYPVRSDAIAYSYQQSGHEFYVLSFPGADVTWVYDLATQLWHKRAWRDSYNVLHRHRTQVATQFQGQVIGGDWQNGNIYTLSQTTYSDNGDIIPCIRRCAHLTTDLKHQYFHDLQLQFQPGVGLQTGQGSDPQAMLEWSDDGGSTWSNQHWVGIGKVGRYKNRARWTRLGSARDRIFQVTVTDPVFRTIVSANLNATAGAN